MNKYVSFLIDSIAIRKKNALRSKVSQFHIKQGLQPTLNNMDEFYIKPVISEIEFTNIQSINNYRKGDFSFPSQFQNNGENNNICRGVFYQNNNDRQINIVIVHGWKSSNLDRVRELFLDRFMQNGYNAYFIKLPHHFERQLPESTYGGEYMISANIDRTLLSIQQAVTDTRDLIAWLNKSSNKSILIGVSLGGLIANLVACHDKNIDALVSIMYANSMAYLIWNSSIGKYIKKDLKDNEFSYQELKRCWEITESSNYKPAIQKNKILLISGRYDRFVLTEDADVLYNNWGKPERLLYKCGHSGQHYFKKDIGADVCSFVEKIIHGETSCSSF